MIRAGKKQIIFIALLATMVSCSSELPEPTEIDLDLKSKQLVEADNVFGLDLFKAIYEKGEENYNISPLSVSLALAMTYNGAEGSTKLAMEETLRLTGLSTNEINQSYKILVQALLGADSQVELGIAQSIWYREDFNVLDDFIEVNQNYYDAEVSALDFAREDAKDIMNGWIEDETNNKIKDMISNVSPVHVMFLINAIYFNGTWQREFDKKETRELPFFKDENSQILVDMMHAKDSILFASNDIMKAVQLPYGRGNFNMLVMLPKNSMDDLIEALTPANWVDWLSSFEMKEDVDLWLPRFKDEYKIKLNDVLSEMGMAEAFNPSADFSGINGLGGIWIDYVQHNTFIDVSEKGTEAAAATVVAIRENAALNDQVFNANRPFIYAITEKETGAILFIGKMGLPKYE